MESSSRRRDGYGSNLDSETTRFNSMMKFHSVQYAICASSSVTSAQDV